VKQQEKKGKQQETQVKQQEKKRKQQGTELKQQEKEVQQQGKKGKYNTVQNIGTIEVALFEVTSSIAKEQPRNKEIPPKVNTKIAEKNKSTKRPTLDHDNSKTNDKKKKTFIDDYEAISIEQAAAKKKQPSTLCPLMKIADFLNEKGEKSKVVIEEENEESCLEQAEQSLNGEVQQDPNLNEEENQETIGEGIYMVYF